MKRELKPVATEKHPFDINMALSRIEEAVRDFPKAALFELKEDGFGSVFEQLVACIISIRTYDEVMLPTARKLFQIARTPAQFAAMEPEEIDNHIRASTFHEAKARQIHDIARHAVAEHNGALPCDEAVLLSLRGVGPKCAHLVLGIACGQAHIGVDVHVHRITNRWKVVQAKTPEQTMVELQKIIPERHWIDLNRLLVPFGKHICTGKLPKCSTCPVLDMCAQAGVTAHR